MQRACHIPPSRWAELSSDHSGALRPSVRCAGLEQRGRCSQEVMYKKIRIRTPLQKRDMSASGQPSLLGHEYVLMNQVWETPSGHTLSCLFLKQLQISGILRGP